MHTDHGDLVAAYQDTRTYDRTYWLDRQTGDVILVDDDLGLSEETET